MIRFIAPILMLTGIMSMIACSGRDPVADEANDLALAPAEAAVIPAAESAAAEPAEEAGPGRIPAVLQGRWGMTPADCTSTRGDAKGLLLISGDSLKFYESVARPAPDVKTSSDSVSGSFAFTGEGMNWTRYQALELQQGKLVRTESDPMTSYTYARCSG
jgi:hypothetical protein